MLVEVATLLITGLILFRVSKRAIEILNKALFYAVIPLTMTTSIIRLAEPEIFAETLGLATLHMLATLAFSMIATRSLRLEKGEEATIVTLSSLPNSIFLALPLSNILLGDAVYALPHAVAFNITVIALLAYLGYSGVGKVKVSIILYATALAVGALLHV